MGSLIESCPIGFHFNIILKMINSFNSMKYLAEASSFNLDFNCCFVDSFTLFLAFRIHLIDSYTLAINFIKIDHYFNFNFFDLDLNLFLTLVLAFVLALVLTLDFMFADCHCQTNLNFNSFGRIR